jgi:hypothetical protein
VSLKRKLLNSVATIGATVGLMAFGTFGAFEDTRGYFPPSVVAPVD